MFIKQLQLRNFKRFTDLTIQNIPADTKLVLLTGSNGSGKSSVFDAFEVLAGLNGKGHKVAFAEYTKHKENDSFDILIDTYEYGKEGLSNNNLETSGKLATNSFYGRTSFRQVPRLTKKVIGQTRFDIASDNDRPHSFIDRDERFENDLEHIFARLLREFFNTNEERSEIKEKIINPINEALFRIFNKENGTRLVLTAIIPPFEGKVADITFKKGDSTFHYNYLSAGEKEVFIILINLIARREYYQDTVYFMDEIDLHLNTALQYNLIKEIVENWIPPKCQFWTASHSLGFIEYANKSSEAAIIDLGNLDFDKQQLLVPLSKENPDVYEIAVSKDMLGSLFQHMQIFFVENTDRTYYATAGIENTVFVSENNRNGVFHKVRTTSYKGIVDRDFLSDDDIGLIKANYPGLYILDYYSIENYLYHPDNLVEYYTSIKQEFSKEGYISDLTKAKNACKDGIIPSLSLKRTEYPYFSEPAFNGKPSQNRFKNKAENMEQAAVVAGYLNSDEFNLYYKVLPMKTYCTSLAQRQNAPRSELAKTNWFKAQVNSLIS